MVVTAVMARVTEAGAKIASRKPRGALAQRLGDSKEMVSHGDVALGEAWARALASRGCAREAYTDLAATPDLLVHAISQEARDALRAPCPSHVAGQCWSTSDEAFGADLQLVAVIESDLNRLAEKGVEVVAVRSAILCAKRLNDGVDRGLNRFVLDLHAMERLVLELRERADGEIDAVCGKVGGFGKYSDSFGPLAGRLHAIEEESRARSAYHFPGVGRLAFVRDGDASDLLVAMASMVGKYVREALMARVVRFYRQSLPDLPDASGYHDPVTTSFIKATRLVRRKSAVPDTCFERRALGDSPPRASRVVAKLG
jgi:hypothetical protein